jgi:hypothetical protein
MKSEHRWRGTLRGKIGPKGTGPRANRLIPKQNPFGQGASKMNRKPLERKSGEEKTRNGVGRRSLIKGAALLSLAAGCGIAVGQSANAAQLDANDSSTGIVDIGGYRLRLVSTGTGFGIAANVYSINETRWVDVPRWVPTIAAGREAAEDQARQYLRRSANLELPAVTWMQGS